MLSKSLYIRAQQCHKSLWLYKHRQDLREQPSEADTVKMRAGIDIGELARQLFPGGELIEFDENDFNGMIERTRQLVEQGCETIYEGCFREDGVFAMCDILRKTPTGWEMYEVKSSVKVKDYHRLDASIQWHVLSQAGLKLSSAAIVYINNSYERMGELDIKSLFTIEDITADVKNMQGEIPSQLREIETMLAGDEPDVDIGPHCSEPYDCDFKKHCRRNIPKQSVFNLYFFRKDKAWNLYHQGIVKLTDLPADMSISPTQRLQVQSIGKSEPTINKEVIRNFLETTSSPMNYLDFETFQEAIPRFDGQRPYRQIPFQYSLHIEHEAEPLGKDGTRDPGKDRLTHKEFLADIDIDPRRILAEKLLADMPKQGKIVAYYMSFEQRVIRKLAEQFGDLRDELLSLNDRMIDLIVPFRGLGYYHDKMNGDFGLKSVLPALFPDDEEIGYQGLSIQEGGSASDTFATLHLVEDPKDVENIRQDLLAYCRMDTLALVKIMDRLREVV